MRGEYNTITSLTALWRCSGNTGTDWCNKS